MSHDKKHPHQKIRGEFRHLIFSPKGEPEGLLLEVDGEPAQLVIDPDRRESQRLSALKAGQNIEVEAAPRKPSPKGEPVHAVHDFHRLLAVDGRKAPDDELPKMFSGTIVRFNFAKHGAPNGVVLDSGDFIHLKPEGMAASGLKIGDKLTASGDARRLSLTSGHVVEARELNGRKLEHASMGAG